MKLKEAQKQIIEMGLTLLESGLVVRSWGNISCRLNDHQFLITPSGRSYSTLTPEELVIVNIIDEQPWGNIIPSVEKGVHLDIYMMRPDVNAIIHTHQTEASALSSMDCGLPIHYSEAFSGEVRCGKYGFPGSVELRNNIREEVLNSGGNAVLMAHHGAVCFGDTLMEAFRCSFLLERTCEQYFSEAAMDLFGDEWHQDMFLYSKLFQRENKFFPKEIMYLPQGQRIGDEIIISQSLKEPYFPLKEEKALAKEIYTAIFKARGDIKYIKQAFSPEILTYSVLGKKLETYVDDFAQINGAVMGFAQPSPDAVVDALGENNGVILVNGGVLCCGSTLDDVESLALVAEKNAHARLTAELFPEKNVNAIPLEECRMMRSFYLDKYAKRF
ncbi:MAG: class II aldolase/adducin family protein [Clostridiales bacterium]